MSSTPKYPSLFQINTRVWLTEISKSLGRQATLDDVSDEELDKLAAMGFDYIWLLSVWTTGEKSRKISRENKAWRTDFENTLPDLTEDDIGGSGFAIASYHVHPQIGGDAALKRIRTRLKKRGLKLMLDFVPNHMGPDHPWATDHPGFFVSGTERDLENAPQNYTRLPAGKTILAYGRDPFFDGWPDTYQLDYSNPSTVAAMSNELTRIAGQCDGVRCDMAMLVLPDIFERTWGRKAQSFWPEVTSEIHEKHPGFIFMAEVYWDLEWEMQQQGFDYAYDKRLYDRLEEGHARPVREHFYAGTDYQNKLARFLENHDEPRAAKTFDLEKHQAAAVVTFFSPGLRFFHQGQFEGRKKRISPHLIRGPVEEVNEEIRTFYRNLLSVLSEPVFRFGQWQLLPIRAAWDGNDSWDSFIAFGWRDEKGKTAMVVVNYSPSPSQCYVGMPIPELKDKTVQMKDLLGSAVYDRNGNDLVLTNLYLDMPAWSYHVFEIMKY